MPRMRTVFSCSVLAVVAACRDTPPPAMPPPPPPRDTASAAPQPPPPAPVTLAADTPYATDAGTSFTAPAGWTLLNAGSRAVLTGPDPDLHVTIVDAPEPTADGAIAAAWRGQRPGFERPLKLKNLRPGRNGWDETQRYVYETSPDEKLVVMALAHRHGAKWTAIQHLGRSCPFNYNTCNGLAMTLRAAPWSCDAGM